jgi:tetratricopeptide (TPR) repeat protein
MIKKVIEDLVEEGRLEEALDQLTEYLKENQSRYPDLLRSAQISQSEFFQEKKRELEGIATAEEIRRRNNQAANKLLDILQHMQLADQPKLTNNPRSLLKWGLLGIGALVLFGLGILVMPGKEQNGENPGEQKKPDTPGVPGLEKYCPKFDDAALYKIGIVNFLTVDNKKTNPAEFLLREIENQFRKANFAGDAELITTYENFNDLSDARLIAENCGCQMVLSGSVFDDNNQRIRISFYSPKFDLKEENKVDSLLQIRAMGTFEDNITQAALILVSRIMLSVNRPGNAIALAEEAYKNYKNTTLKAATPKNGPQKNLLPVMTLAQVYTRTNHHAEAIALYNEILVDNPQDSVALGNKTILQFKTGQLDSALVTANETAKVKQKKTGWHLLQSEIHVQKGELNKALRSVERARQLKPDNPMVKERILEVKQLQRKGEGVKQ